MQFLNDILCLSFMFQFCMCWHITSSNEIIYLVKPYAQVRVCFWMRKMKIKGISLHPHLRHQQKPAFTSIVHMKKHSKGWWFYWDTRGKFHIVARFLLCLQQILFGIFRVVTPVTDLPSAFGNLAFPLFWWHYFPKGCAHTVISPWEWKQQFLVLEEAFLRFHQICQR